MNKEIYLDFDGVILNTNTFVTNIIKSEMKNYKEVPISKSIPQIISLIDWKEVISQSSEINNSISNIEKIISLKNLSVNIISHVASINEMEEKSKFIYGNIPGVKVIFVPKSVPKDRMVVSKNLILIDDYTPNLINWKIAGGIPIKFISDQNKIRGTEEIFTISNIYDVIDSEIQIKNLYSTSVVKLPI